MNTDSEEANRGPIFMLLAVLFVCIRVHSWFPAVWLANHEWTRIDTNVDPWSHGQGYRNTDGLRWRDASRGTLRAEAGAGRVGPPRS
jgi:hypothetical protein